MMVRLLVRESLYTTLWLVAVTAATFAGLDLASDQDWFGAVARAEEIGLDPRTARTGGLPIFWNNVVADAQTRTRADLDALATSDATGAELRLTERGSAALPTVLDRVRRLPPASRGATLRVLARWSRTLTGREEAPSPQAGGSDAAALAWWDRFQAAHALDFRAAYAQRQAERIASRDSRNAAERVARLGTYAIPSLIATLDAPLDREGERRVAGALAGLTRIAARDRGAWRAWWFARHLEYETLSPWRRTLGHVTETRYGQWLVRALRGDLGVSRVTGHSVGDELRARLPMSTLASGLGGLLAVAGLIAFGGGKALRGRPFQVKLLDLAGALIPGSLAFFGAWAIVLRLCRQDGGALVGAAGWLRVVLSTVACGALAALWFRRPAARLVLHAVRIEAEQWARESLSPTGLQVVRHGARIGAASLLAPMALAAPAVLLASLAVELVFGLRGMGELTARALARVDGPWILAAAVTLVPLLLARRWALGVLAWLLGVREGETRVSPQSPPANAPAPAAAP
jgi:peptide/nickel transport system permease protein